MSSPKEHKEYPESILVIDTDDVTLHLVKNHFAEVGISNVDRFKSPEEGWEALRWRDYDLIIFDWELPEFSGARLFNRLRGLTKFISTPVIVMSRVLYPKDFKLLQEYPVSELLDKPFAKPKLERKIREVWAENLWYLQNNAMIETLMQAVERDGKKAIKLVKNLVLKAPNPIPLAIISGKYLSENRFHREAEEIFELVLKLDHKSILAMAELGKIYLRQERYEEASRILAQVNKISPKNIERLCILGELDMRMEKYDEASEHFDKALEIDPDHEPAKAGNTVAKNLKSFLDKNPDQDIPKNFASLLNLVGISMIKAGQMTKGVGQYESALNFVRAADDRARLTFNLGLGYLKWGKKPKALDWFEKSVECGSENFKKSSGYVQKLKDNVQLDSADQEEVAVEDREDDDLNINVNQEPEAI